MGPVIRNLLALQDVDLEIISLNDQKAGLLRLANEKKSEIQTRQREFEGRQAQLKRLKVEIKKSEVELAEVADRIRKLEGQQVHVKTNQEYKALDKEIYEAKARKAKAEDFLLEKMEILEQEDAGVHHARQNLGPQAARLEQEATSIEDDMHHVERRVNELRQNRNRVASAIERKYVALYDRIFNSKSGPAIVPLVNRACQGCHLAVPAAVESILRRDEADIITCENCSRILYIPDEDNSSQ
jgi:predicted  nucleic acid-binding Zn-ribbon protein